VDLRSWATVGVTDHPTGSLITTDVERANLYMAPAILHRGSRGGMTVTLSSRRSRHRQRHGVGTSSDGPAANNAIA